MERVGWSCVCGMKDMMFEDCRGRGGVLVKVDTAV